MSANSTAIDPQALQAALAQLNDIALPAEPGFWPLALGWWLLLLSIVLVTLGAVLFAYWRRKTALRRAALAHWQALKNLENDAQAFDDQAFLVELAQMLRRASLVRYPASAGLTDEAWAEHLNHSGKTNFFSTTAGQQLLQARFAKHVSVDRERHLQAAHDWLKVAL